MREPRPWQWSQRWQQPGLAPAASSHTAGIASLLDGQKAAMDEILCKPSTGANVFPPTRQGSRS